MVAAGWPLYRARIPARQAPSWELLSARLALDDRVVWEGTDVKQALMGDHTAGTQGVLGTTLEQDSVCTRKPVVIRAKGIRQSGLRSLFTHLGHNNQLP